MKQTYNNILLRNIDFYNAMLKAYADGMTEFEYNDLSFGTDDAFMDFTHDIKSGKLKVIARENI